MKRTRKHDDPSVTKLPPIPRLDLVLYHWSPTANRRSIERLGLTPGRKTLQGDWRPPYIAFSDEPRLAWFLSGRMWPEIKHWDLWMCYFEAQDSFDHYEIITDTYPDSGRTFVKEYRIYTRIYKRDLHYVGSREN
jgi:hypothetical protein